MCNIKGESLADMISNLPPILQKIVGLADIPADEGHRLMSTAIAEPIVLSSDGSLRETNTGIYGGHGYSIQVYSDDENRIVGRAATP